MRLNYILGVMVVISILTTTFFKISSNKKESEILKLNDEKLTLNNKFTLCNAYLEKQNLEIKALKLDENLSPKKPKEIERVEKIYIKDKSCESELRAYKELFK